MKKEIQIKTSGKAKPLLAAGWIDAAKKKPKCNRKFNESDYVLCFANHTQFVGWYNSKLNEWFVGHFLARTVPLSYDNVPTHWMELPVPPACG